MTNRGWNGFTSEMNNSLGYDNGNVASYDQYYGNRWKNLIDSQKSRVPGSFRLDEQEQRRVSDVVEKWKRGEYLTPEESDILKYFTSYGRN